MARVPPQRLRRAEELLATGVPTTEAVELLVTEFSVSARTAWRDIDRVYDQWAAEQQERHQVLRHQRVKFLERVARAAFQDGTYSAAVAAMKQICRVEGLEQLGVNLKHTVNATAELSVTARLDRMTSAEKRRALAKLMEKRARTMGPEGIDQEIAWLHSIKAKLEAGDDDWEDVRMWQRHPSAR